MTRLLVLGSPRVDREGSPVELPRHKALALLVYLAITQESHSRDTLATMFWPEADASHARGALRRTLSDIRQSLGKSILNATGETIGLQSAGTVSLGEALWVDAHRFHTLVSTALENSRSSPSRQDTILQLNEAVHLYRDDFMQGFTLPDSPAFDEWQFFQTESYRRELAAALAWLVQAHMADGETAKALAFARRWSALDPLVEESQQALIRLYAMTHQQAAAWRQYREYARLLQEELGAAPSESITLLAQSIRRGEARTEGNVSLKNGANEELVNQVQDEIRLVTILLAGLAGADHLTDTIRESAKALQDIVRACSSEYDGHVGDFIGEGIQVVFGYPQMHEDDAERALRTALSIQHEANRANLAVSVGLSMGQVYFGPKDANGSQVTTIGPVVSLAARLQAHSEPGQILVSSGCFRQTQRAFNFNPATIESTAGTGLIKAFELIDVVERPAKMRGIDGMRAKLIGRDNDLSQCETTLQSLNEGRGGVLSISGEAGIGKSRLVEELHRLCFEQRQRSSLLWLSSRSSEFSASVPYSTFVDLLHYWLDTFRGSGESRAQALSRVLNQMVEDGNLPHAVVRDKVAPFLGHLLSIPFGTDWDTNLAELHPEQVKQQTFQAVSDFLSALARRQSLVFVFEDLHWADAISLDLLAYLLEAVQSFPILLICVYRPESVPKLKRLNIIASQKCPGQHTELVLRELTPAQSQDMVRSLLGVEELPLSVRGLIQQVWGNPFFIEEMIRALIESESLYRSNGGWATSAAVSLPVPESVQSVILSRIDRLPRDLKRVLSAAAVIGRSFEARVLEYVLPGNIDPDRALNRLEESALIFQERVVPDSIYSFRHAIIQETVYQTLPRHQRDDLHLAVAHAVEQLNISALQEHYEELAHHYSQSQAYDKATEYSLKAGEKSRHAFLNQVAIEHFDRALELADKLKIPDALVARFEALSGLGRLYYLVGRADDAERCFREAIDLTQKVKLEPQLLARLFFRLGQVLYWQGKYGEHLWLGQAGLDLLSDREPESIEAALMNHMIASSSLRRGDRDTYHALADKNVQFLHRLPYDEELTPLYEHVLSSLSDQKRLKDMGPWLEKLEELAQEHNDTHARAIILERKAENSFESGRLSDAASELAQARKLHSDIGDNVNIWRCESGLAWIHLLEGKLLPAEINARMALEAATKLGFNRIRSESHFVLAAVHLAEHKWEQAADEFERAGQHEAGSDPFWTEWASAYGRGRALLAEGQRGQALNQFQSALQHFSPQLAPLGWAQHRSWSLAASILSGLENTFHDNQAFKAFCSNFEELTLQYAVPPIPMQWYPEAAAPDAGVGTLRVDFDLATENDAAKWVFRDPIGDCQLKLAHGIDIQASNGRDLWFLNTTAPRLLLPVTGDCAIEVLCSQSRSELPAIGGLLLWKDDSNFVRLVGGTRGENDVAFEGCVDNAELIVGRGLLPITSGTGVWLRLERTGEQVRALASADGRSWLGIGRIAFPVSHPIEIGVLAIGWIDRTVYPGDFPNGTAIHFESVKVWTKNDGG